MESQKVHLVCSSGGMKCFSYIGAIQELLKNNITIASVSGCSQGTVIGAMLCAGLPIEQIEKHILEFNFSQFKTGGFFSFLRRLKYPYAKLKTPNFEKIMTQLLGEDIKLKQMKIPFSVAALDVRQNRFLVYSSETHPEMRVSETIKIATAIPFLYPPHKLGKRILVDAAIASQSPVWMAAKNPGNYPIVVLKPLREVNSLKSKKLKHFLGDLFSASAASHDYFTTSQNSRVIEININCENIDYTNFNITKDQIEGLLQEGQLAVENKLKEYKYDFGQVLDIEEIKGSIAISDGADIAEALASSLITESQNKIKNRSNIFVSYSHQDRDWMLKMKNYLKTLERFEGIKAWDDHSIKAGDEWNKEIDKALLTTKVAVFLVTQSFLASEFIQEKEMGYFLEISKKEKVPIIWVAVSSSLYERTPLKDIQCANDPENPLDLQSDGEQNATLTNISKQIIQKMEGSA